MVRRMLDRRGSIYPCDDNRRVFQQRQSVLGHKAACHSHPCPALITPTFCHCYFRWTSLQTATSRPTFAKRKPPSPLRAVISSQGLLGGKKNPVRELNCSLSHRACLFFSCLNDKLGHNIEQKAVTSFILLVLRLLLLLLHPAGFPQSPWPPQLRQ